MGADPDQSVVVWNTHHKDLVAVAKCDGARGPMRAISWRPEAALGEFLTLNNGEVILWTLEDTPGSPSLASHCTVLPTREAPEASAGNVAPRARSYTSLAALDRARVLVSEGTCLGEGGNGGGGRGRTSVGARFVSSEEHGVGVGHHAGVVLREMWFARTLFRAPRL